MSLKLQGTIKEIQQEQVVGVDFRKRLFVISVQDGNYSNDTAFEFHKDKTGILDQYSIGQLVDVDFNARSKEYKGNWFTNLVAWKIALVGWQQAQQPQSSQPKPAQAPVQKEDDDQLPF